MPPAPYATRADLYAWIGPEKAQQYFGAGKLSGDALGAAVDAGLIESQAIMDMAFERGDYTVPIPLSPVWASTLTFSAADVTFYAGAWFQNLTATNTATPPPSDAVNWLLTPAPEVLGRNPLGLMAILKRYCRIGAVRTQLAGLQGVEEGMKEELAAFAAFLEAIQMGTEDLPGLDRTGGEAERLVAGRIGFQGSGERKISHRVMRAFNHGLLGGGGMTGNAVDDGGGPP